MARTVSENNAIKQAWATQSRDSRQMALTPYISRLTSVGSDASTKAGLDWLDPQTNVLGYDPCAGMRSTMCILMDEHESRLRMVKSIRRLEKDTCVLRTHGNEVERMLAFKLHDFGCEVESTYDYPELFDGTRAEIEEDGEEEEDDTWKPDMMFARSKQNDVVLLDWKDMLHDVLTRTSELISEMIDLRGLHERLLVHRLLEENQKRKRDASGRPKQRKVLPLPSLTVQLPATTESRLIQHLPSPTLVS